MTYLIYILATIGGGYFVTQSELMESFREYIRDVSPKYIPLILLEGFYGVITCVYCASFWIGVSLYWVMFAELTPYALIYPFSVMGVIWITKNIG